ncbi:hypothetical protein HKBW3S03_01622 [Candidatus Hakubella thermalkaliphila]|uniref:Helix-turn-helix domain-containing protein n=1 Tax=Candidatus Hakubella thermalkaliphila TaxID=2754717 RepID=A0A6V8QDT1_9ACTN|nr:helix-turn-helix domain-containing protein [Candidatus Hakubella thermalkaliphila]GFP20119.1 hypothetical protein HKBW3S03_01622 [Candidatus Hakubella thermalkaliphila]GFP29975.1 hypothetical protein HKBW3S34_00895 [Candidatus Hakubella thermalkaliphila]GFP38019.1 hypothetical protein HKBW3S44_01699 [Candidatus Hakubella thermalkaliphila]GFP42757.1 hypothetical protein HKBW3C_01881 [Candidatus Hakubella thermalkaliphila]
MPTKEIMTPEQVADYLQLNSSTVYRYIREGKLFASKIGRQYRVPKESVELLLMVTAMPQGLRLRRYGREQVQEFLREDELDQETRAKAEKLITALGRKE